jgi:CheY-like chemotaxis protein
MTDIPVLVVEDNEMNLRLVRYLLVAKGWVVRSATNAAETFEVLKDFHPRLILMDLQLPGTDGYELTRRLKAAPGTKNIVIVALTAFAMKGDEERARAAGCDGYVTKPIDTRAFAATLANFLGSSGGP